MQKMYLLGFVCLFGFVLALKSQPAIALVFDLERPSVAFSQDYPEACRGQVLSALNCDVCEFVGGSGINSFSLLLYRGDTKALDAFLKALADCRRIHIRVSFVRPVDEKDALGHAYRESDWWVEHTPEVNAFHIKVNLDSKQIDLEQLHLPEVHTVKVLRVDQLFSWDGLFPRGLSKQNPPSNQQ